MTITRRDFTLLAAATAAAGLPLSRALAAYRQHSDDTSVFDWRTLNDHMHVAFDQGGNVLLAKTPDAIVLIDSKNAGFGPSLKREATSLLANPDILINTHHHGDHTGGNESFSSSAQIITQHNAETRIRDQVDAYTQGIARMQSQLESLDSPTPELLRSDTKELFAHADALDADDFAPTRTVQQERGHSEITKGVEVGYVTPGHTDNDMAVFFPEQNVLHMGDLLFHELHPFIRLTDGASTTGWIETLEHIAKDVCNENTTVIPGHGEITDHTGIQKQISYFQKNRDIVAKAIEQGSSRDDIIALKPEHSKDYGFLQMRQLVLGVIYDEMTDK